MQRRCAVLIQGVDRRVGVEQRVEHVGAAGAGGCGEVERGAPAPGDRQRVRVGVEQLLDGN